MGSYDGAELCELVGLFILKTLEKRFGANIGRFGDEGLAAINTTFGRLGNKARKDLGQIPTFGLKITAVANLRGKLPRHNFRPDRRHVQTLPKTKRRTSIH